MKSKNTLALLLFCLLTGLTSCQEHSHTYLTELQKYKTYIETANQDQFYQALNNISKCDQKDSAIVHLKTTILSLHKNTNKYLSQLDALQNKAEFETFKVAISQSLDSLKQEDNSGRRYPQTLKDIDIESLPEEEAKIVLQANILLMEQGIRENILSKWAIDCI